MAKPKNWDEVRAIENPTERLVNALDLAIKSTGRMELIAKGGIAYNIIEGALQEERSAANALALSEGSENKYKTTVLHVAAHSNAPDLTKLLLDHDADPNAIRMASGNTALIDTLYQNYSGTENAIATANALLDAGADPKRGGIYQDKIGLVFPHDNNTTALHQLIKRQTYTSDVYKTLTPPEQLIPLLDKMIAKGADLDAVCDFSVGPESRENSYLHCYGGGEKKSQGTALDLSEALYPDSPVTAHLRELTFEHAMHQLPTEIDATVGVKQAERLGKIAGKLLEAHAYGDADVQHVLEAMRDAGLSRSPQEFLASAQAMPPRWEHHNAI